MTKLTKFDPQNRKKDMTHDELRQYKVARNKPIPRERSGGNRQRFMNVVVEDDDNNDEEVNDYEFHTQTN